MIRKREQLINMSAKWINMAKNDLRNRVLNFIEETGISNQELANMIAISDGELEQIINGNGEITLSTFAKLLIASGNTIAICPIFETPFGDYENMPNPSDMEELENIRRGVPMDRKPRFGNLRDATVAPMGGMPKANDSKTRMPMGELNIPRGFTEAPISTAPKDEEMLRRGIAAVPMGGMPMGNAEPRNAKHMGKKVKRVKINLDELDKRGLENIVLSNHWDNEIDINASSRSELIDFLQFKERMINDIRNQQNESKQAPSVAPSVDCNCHHSNKDSDEVERIKNFLYKTFEENPQLRNIVNKYLD